MKTTNMNKFVKQKYEEYKELDTEIREAIGFIPYVSLSIQREQGEKTI